MRVIALRANSIIASICALAIVAGSVPAVAMPFGSGPANNVTIDGSSDVTLVGHRHRKKRRRRFAQNNWQNNQWQGRRWNKQRRRGHRRYRRNNDGLGLIIGLAGLGIGLAVANNYNHSHISRSNSAGYCPAPGTIAWRNFCLNKYRSYVPATDMYTRYSGQKAYCTCP